MPVIARVNNKFAGIFNNEHFVIKHTTATEITVNDGERKITIPQADFQRTFYVAYAMTVCKSQGSTFQYSYTIHEWAKLNHRLKCVSRYPAPPPPTSSIVSSD